MEPHEDRADRLAEQRDRLLGQLRYLIDEAKALEPLLEDLPAEVLETSPPDEFSVKEALGLLADCDRKIFLPRLHRMIGEDRPELESIDEGRLVEDASWGKVSMPKILTAVEENRDELISFLENLPPDEWHREGLLSGGDTQTVYELAYFIGQHDVHYLRQLGLMMHSTNLTDGQDLPK
jgi:hypothetical protein